MRSIVIGTSGCGKSTFARALANARGVKYVELDGLNWLPNWTERSSTQFRELVAEATSAERWVVDGNYGDVRDILWSRATHVVWLNFGRLTVFSRVIRRTIRRVLTHEELWAGNRESLRRALLERDSILWWSFTTFGKNRSNYAQLRASGLYAHLQWQELRSASEARTFLHAVHAEPRPHVDAGADGRCLL